MKNQFMLSPLRIAQLSVAGRLSLRPNQERRERTIDEVKTEAVHRAEVGQYPLIGLDPADVKEAFESIHTADKDEWAAGFMRVADRYFNEAKSLEKSDPTKANADYIRAWRIYSFGRWPIPSSPGKQRSYEKAIEAFLDHAKFFDPPLEVVRIPFEGKEIIGYLRLPKNAKGPVPLVIAVNGLDSRKEDLTESFGAILPFGIGFLAVDGPGTGQAPIKVSETSERMLSKVIDYAQSRPEIDKNRIALHGVSWGAYWATKMAIVERARLRGCQRAIASGRQIFPERFPDELAAGQSRISFRSGARAHEYSRRRSLARRDGRVPAENVAGASGTARQADGAHASHRRRPRHAGSHRRRILAAEQRRRPQRSLDQPPRRPSGPASRRVARSPDLQASNHPLAGKNAAAPAN